MAQRPVQLRGLELHAFPVIGRLAVCDVDLAGVRRVIEPIWYDKARVAQLVRANIEAVLNFAHSEGQRTADNPARWDLLKHSLPARKGARVAGHYRAVAYSDMPDLLEALNSQRSIAALCLRFTILTVARTKESRACRWSDINFANRIRVVDILKSGGEVWQHQVPLSDQAIELLRSLLVDGNPATEYVFPGRSPHLGANAMLDLLERIG